MREYIKRKSSIENTKDCFFSGFYIILGMIMGVADSLPGISSSTILLLSKQYEFVISIFARIFSKDFFQDLKYFIVNFHFLSFNKIIQFFNSYNLNFSLSLVIGITIGFVSSFFTIAYFLEEYYDITLRIISVIMIFVTLYYVYEYKTIFLEKKYFKYYMYFAIIGFLVYMGLILVSEVEANYYLAFLVAFLSITVMLLPGISGSLLLVLFGMYVPIKNALISFDYVFLSIYFSGSILGLIIGLKTIDYLNKHFEIRMKFALLGILTSSTVFLIYRFLF